MPKSSSAAIAVAQVASRWRLATPLQRQQPKPGKAGESARVWRSAQSTGSKPVLIVSQRVVGSVQQLFSR